MGRDTPPFGHRPLSIPERIAQTELLLEQTSKRLDDVAGRLHLGSETMGKVNTSMTQLMQRMTDVELAVRPQSFWKTLLPFIPVILALVAGIVYLAKLPTRTEYDAVRAQSAETRRALEGQAGSIQLEQARQAGETKAIREILDRQERQQVKIDEKLNRALRGR